MAYADARRAHRDGRGGRCRRRGQSRGAGAWPPRPAGTRQRGTVGGGRHQDRQDTGQQGRRATPRPVGDVSAGRRGRSTAAGRYSRGRQAGVSRQARSGRRHRTRAGRADPAHPRGVARVGASSGGRHQGAGVPGADQRRLCSLPGAGHVPGPGGHRRASMTAQYSPAELAGALGLFTPTEEQAAVIAAPPGPLVVIAGAGAGKTETMAARVVWLVANGYARPGQVLGLTFTRKAAGQLLRRVRTRLARLGGGGPSPASGWGYLPLAGACPHPGEAGLAPGLADDPAIVSTYHAFAGALLREHGLLLPVEPDTRLLSETELWQLAFRVISDYPGELHTDETPAAVTTMVLRLAGQLAEHLVDTGQLLDTHVELERLGHMLPAGPYQRDRGPSQWLLRMLATQTERTELVPLIDALHRRMRAEKVMDFGMQMGSAARR